VWDWFGVDCRKGRKAQYRCPEGHVYRDEVLVDGLVVAELVKLYAESPPPLPDDSEAKAAQEQIADIEAELADWVAALVGGRSLRLASPRLKPICWPAFASLSR